MVERSRRSRRKRRAKQPVLGNHQRCWLWGRHVVLETLAAGKWPIYELRLSSELSEADCKQVCDQAEQAGVLYKIEPGEELTKQCGSQEHQGYLAKMPPYPYDDIATLEDNWPSVPLFLMLDGIQDPYNFGAILRSAEVLGADAVVIGQDHQTGITSQVARSSAGAVNHLRIVRTKDLTGVLESWKARRVKIFGASEKSSVPIYNLDCTTPLALILGNEGFGIRPQLLDCCDELTAIPQSGQVGSLNVAVSLGILCYEVSRQRALAR